MRIEIRRRPWPWDSAFDPERLPPMIRILALACALTLALWPADRAGAADAQEAGKVAAMATLTEGFPPDLPAQTLFVGANVVRNERVTTDAGGLAQFLFLDGSTFTLSRNSSVT